MAVHYKFVSSRDYDTVKFDGGFITVADLKRAISAQKKLDRSADTDLLITNATTGEGPFGVAYAYAYALHTNPTPCTALRSLERTHVPDAFFLLGLLQSTWMRIPMCRRIHQS